MNLSLPAVSAYWDELEKISATRALKKIRTAFKTGGPEEADTLARKWANKGAIKRTEQGSQLMPRRGPGGVLGSGQEGIAVATVGRKGKSGGLSARKTLDPKSWLVSDEMTKRKFEVGQELKKSRKGRHYARLLSDKIHKGTTKGKPSYMHYEHVKGTTPQDEIEKYQKGISAAGKKTGAWAKIKGGAKAGTRFGKRMGKAQLAWKRGIPGASKKYELADIEGHPENTIITDKGAKIIDYLPIKKGKEYQDFKDRGLDALPKGGPKIGWSTHIRGGHSPKTEEVLGGLGPGSRQKKKDRTGRVIKTPGTISGISETEKSRRLKELRKRKAERARKKRAALASPKEQGA